MASADAPLITTIITTFERPALLSRAIKSVLAQTFTRFKVCVYDDASRDETEGIIRYFAEQDNRVEYYRHPANIGAPSNWDFGVRHVKTPFFSVLSDDDILLPDFYEKALAQFSTYPSAEVVIGDTIFLGMDHSYFGGSTGPFKAGFYGRPEGLLAMCRYPQPSWSAALFRKQVIDVVGTLDTTLFSMDYDFVLRVAAKCPYVIFHDPVVMFTMHPNQSTAILQLHMVWPTRYAAMEKILHDDHISPAIREQVKAMLTRDLSRMLFFIGLRALTLDRLVECRDVLRILGRPLRSRRRRFVLGATAALVRLHPIFKEGLVKLHSWRRRRQFKKQALPTGFFGYCAYYDSLWQS
jgi:glycosyltransferase involved in cell wall biosynthesis